MLLIIFNGFCGSGIETKHSVDICPSISEVSARRLKDWELESLEGSFTHMSSSSCLLSEALVLPHMYFSVWFPYGQVWASSQHGGWSPQVIISRKSKSESESRIHIIFLTQNSHSFTSNVFYWWKQLQRCAQF